MISIKQILVPTDFSEPSVAAIRYGKAFAEQFHARLHLLHVVEDALATWPASEGMEMITPVTLDEVEKAAHAELSKVLTPEEREKYQARIVTVRGGASQEIVDYARNEKIDLIIMGTHGRSPIAHALLGSVAEKAVRKTPCPVLVVRHPEHEFLVE